MRKNRALADRIANTSLWLLAAVNVLFVLAFAVTLLFATSPAHSQADETIACNGRNLLEEFLRNDPEQVVEIEREAGRTPNGKGLLWKIEKDGIAPSFLFGTMHVTDPRVTSLPDAAKAAFDEARTVVIETTDILDQQAVMAAMVEEPGLMMFPPGEALTDHLTAEQREIVSTALDARGVPLSSVVKMKPWMLVSLVALPACEQARQQAGKPVLDVKLAKDAKAAGKKLAGLESVGEQLRAMASLPMPFHIEGLVSTLSMGDRVDDVIETMIQLYSDGETAMFRPMLEQAVPGDGASMGYAEFEAAMVTARNATMAERALPILKKGHAFIAVGAMHLPGKDGLVEKLRQAGYRVTRAL
ncbi:TraB/GumN family protein [Nitratireductor luteus]|uniref:TraB/GumN family protein n=1 Tax=Nitratireductor luteus TaxID=2976980 RepID=UPI00223FF4CF|nr:TraB/GumN family protein [Nitratireductor luteus]